MATNTPLISIVILNWNGLEDTKKCLDAVRELDYKNYEIIIVDNGSSSDQKDYLSHLADIIYIDNPVNRGFAGGQVDGYKIAKGDFILLLNNDALIKSDYIKEALLILEDVSVAAVGGRSYFWNDIEQPFDETNRFFSYMDVNPETAETTLQIDDNNMPQEVNVVSGSAVIVRRSVIDKVGYLHEPFFAYYEETDLFARIKRAGYKVIYSPRLRIWHKNGASSGSSGGSKFFYYHIFRNRFLYAMRNFEGKYLKKFLYNYYTSGLRALAHIPFSENQYRLGVSYFKAILATFLSLPNTLVERQQLARQLPTYNYCERMLTEQVRLSVVRDKTKSSQGEVESLLASLRSNPHPLTENIVVISEPKKPYPTSMINNARLVIDRGYFGTHPLNIGWLAAKHPWVLIGGNGSESYTEKYRQIIAALHTTNITVVSLDQHSIVVKADYLKKIGGLSTSPKDLQQNIDYIKHYADHDNKLSARAEFVTHSSPACDEIIESMTYNDALDAKNNPSLFQKITARYYRLQQVSNLAEWLLSPSIKTRLKIARLKNLMLFAASFKRSKLATELRHIRNEVYLFNEKHSLIRQQSKNIHKIKTITENRRKQILETPVFIICFERVDSLKILVNWLESRGLRKIILIDNNSTYPALLDYYDTTGYQVLRLYRNIGHTSPWAAGIIRSLVPDDYYIVSDPDVIPTENTPEDVLSHLFEAHSNYPEYLKVGLGLKIDDIPEYYPLRREVCEWEAQFWTTRIGDIYFEAGVDTTFALYKPFTYVYTLHPSLRTDSPYLARHLPWYIDPTNPTEEEFYYRKRANKNVTSWNVEELPDRYKQEMKK